MSFNKEIIELREKRTEEISNRLLNLSENRKVMLGLHSQDDETFLRTYLSIPDDRFNDVPNDVWNLIVKRLRDMPKHEKSELLNKINDGM